MRCCRSLKDTAKALNGLFANATIRKDLPKEIQQALETFLQKHEHIDDHDSQRLQEELHNIQSKYVAKDKGKLGVVQFKYAMMHNGEQMLEHQVEELLNDSNLIYGEFIMIEELAKYLMSR